MLSLSRSGQCSLILLAAAGLSLGAPSCSGSSEPGGDDEGSVTTDSNGDGVADQLGEVVDADGDGEPDVIDIDGDGEPDGTAIDTDGDGEPDAAGIDTDGDGVIDGLDTDGDGEVDIIVDPNPGSGGSGTVVIGPIQTGGSGGTDLPTSGPWTPGITSTVQTSLPGGEPLACEWDWTVRLLSPFPNYQVGHAPRRLYNASCDTETPNPSLFTSYTIGEKIDAGYEGTSGAITKSRFNPETGALEVEQTYHFPECRSMHGVAASSNCGTVAALCRIPNTATGEDYDAVAKWSGADWMTNENTCGNTMKMNDHMWLYEWPDGDLSKTPTKVIVHKSIGSWEYGQDTLRFGEDDNTYGVALKATVGEQGSCHEADSFMILNRDDWSFVQGRGWDWACASGHTIHNRSAYNPANKKYAMFCSTDWREADVGNVAEAAFHREDLKKTVVHHIPRYNANWIKGGAGPIIPRDDGGFLMIIVGEPEGRGTGYDDTTPVELGLIAFDADGAQEGDIKWVAKHETDYYSWPQFIQLDTDRYLLSWGEGYEAGSRGDEKAEPHRNLHLRVPWTYWMMEIDGEGNPLTSPAEVTDAGWGEVNEMVSLGQGRAAWSYVPDDRVDPEEVKAPDCNQNELVHYVYTSESQPE